MTASVKLFCNNKAMICLLSATYNIFHEQSHVSNYHAKTLDIIVTHIRSKSHFENYSFPYGQPQEEFYHKIEERSITVKPVLSGHSK